MLSVPIVSPIVVPDAAVRPVGVPADAPRARPSSWRNGPAVELVAAGAVDSR